MPGFFLHSGKPVAKIDWNKVGRIAYLVVALLVLGTGMAMIMSFEGMMILVKLLSYPKKTFTRQQLMDEFWDADSDTAPRAVDVYMTKLRSRLADCDAFEIKTVHGLGYKAVLK